MNHSQDSVFKEALEFVFRSEGGTNTSLLDRGGLTKLGISSKSYPSLDIEALTLEDITGIYKRDFWVKNSCGMFERYLAIALFDSSVNCGAASAAVWLQQALNLLNTDLPPLLVDGFVGDETRRRVGVLDQHKLLNCVVAKRLARYTKLVKAHPEQLVHISGWINRVSNLLLFI